MKIERIQIKVRDLIDGYEEKGTDGIEGVVGYGGKLDVRPAYQREYIYGEKDRDEVLRSVKKHFPINIMYWAKIDNDRYEVMDSNAQNPFADMQQLKILRTCVPLNNALLLMIYISSISHQIYKTVF